jgi:hypothetical protein
MKQIILLWIATIMMLPLTAQQPDSIPEIMEEMPESEEIEEAMVATEEAEAKEVEEANEVDAAIEAAIANKQKARPQGDTVNVIGKVEVIETPESTKVTLGKNEVIIVEENGDTVRVVLGSRGIRVVEGDNGTEVKVLEMDDMPTRTYHKKKKFRPHYAGLELGMNNYLTPDFSLVLPPGEEFMDLNTGKSWCWNLNVVDFGIGFGTDYIGLATGLGFNFMNYNFNGQNGIMKDPDTGETVEYIPPYAGNITKSKMNITYMTAPLMLEFQIPTQGRGRVYISGGVLGSVKLWSNTKIKYTEAGDKSKEKNKNDFNLSPIRWGFTARVGYRGFGIYANYYMTSLFKSTMGPELYPFDLGLAFNF